MARALIVHGGWEGHEPAAVARVLGGAIESNGVMVTFASELAALGDAASFDLVVPLWTMGEVEPSVLASLLAAVETGTGFGGVHGTCDAFRTATDYQFLTGGQWVAHPGGGDVEYTVRIADRAHEITQGLDDFVVRSEQYYLHVDPSNHVLATTGFPVADGPHAVNGAFDMPVAWTRRYGRGRVFYCSLGHDVRVLTQEPVLTLCARGLAWAATGSARAGGPTG